MIPPECPPGTRVQADFVAKPQLGGAGNFKLDGTLFRATHYLEPYIIQSHTFDPKHTPGSSSIQAKFGVNKARQGWMHHLPGNNFIGQGGAGSGKVDCSAANGCQASCLQAPEKVGGALLTPLRRGNRRCGCRGRGSSDDEGRALDVGASSVGNGCPEHLLLPAASADACIPI